MTRVETLFADLLGQVDLLLDRRTGQAEQADVVSDLLGFLAERMTDLHRQRQEEMGAFLEWIEERVGAPIDELSGKTLLRAYDEQAGGADGFLVLLERNRSKIDIDVSAPEAYRATNLHRDRIVEGYERSTARLAPIRRQIQLTDALIDRIVYRLYGLTEEEIELVESS